MIITALAQEEEFKLKKGQWRSDGKSHERLGEEFEIFSDP